MERESWKLGKKFRERDRWHVFRPTLHFIYPFARLNYLSGQTLIYPVQIADVV